ncbi:hypothetical protein SAMN04488137_4206 [Fictibacillus solisalsi]|uniref:Uncharacterized protein n=1 Tax=Fictibacillus solisalsi TaxID=459525 RepID=A0A1H0ATM1_9BACL|nr:hypothetical protein SAMN04488137_4206 [Fictibacillus solisalsi]
MLKIETRHVTKEKARPCLKIMRHYGMAGHHMKLKKSFLLNKVNES